MTIETTNYSKSVHKLFRGLRKDVPDFTEDDYKQRVPKSGRVCTNVRPIYSEPVIRFCPKYGCVYKRKITGHVIDFLDLQTLKLTQVYQKNAYDGFWDIYDGPFKPSLSEKGTLENEVSGAGAAAGEPNNMNYGKKKKREKAMRKQLDTHAYDQPKLKSKSKATFKASNDHSGTPRVSDGQRPIKANLELLTSLSLSYDNSDGSDKSAPAKLIHLAISWENNDHCIDASKKKHYHVENKNKTGFKQLPIPQLLNNDNDNIDHSETSDDLDHSIAEAKLLQLSFTKATVSDDNSDPFKTINDMAQETKNVDTGLLSDTGLKSNYFTEESKARDDIHNFATKAELLPQATTRESIEDHSDVSKTRNEINDDASRTELLQRAITGHLLEYNSDPKNTIHDMENIGIKAGNKQLITTKVLNDNYPDANKTKDDIVQGENNGDFSQLVPPSVLKANSTDAFKDRDDKILDSNKIIGLEQVKVIVPNVNIPDRSKAEIEITHGAKKNELLQKVSTGVSNDDHSNESKTKDDIDQCISKVDFLEIAAAAVTIEDHSDAPKTKDDMGQCVNNVNPMVRETNDDQIDQSKTTYEVHLVQSANKTGIEEQGTQFDMTYISKEIIISSFDHEVVVCSWKPIDLQINTSKTKHDVDNNQTQCETKELKTPKESVALHQKVTMDLNQKKPESGYISNPSNNKDVNSLKHNRNEIANDSENHIFEMSNYHNEIIRENVLNIQVTGDKVSLKTDLCQTDNSKHLNNETATVEIENDILTIDIISEDNSIMDEYSIKHNDAEKDETCQNDYMAGILGIYAKGQQNYIIDNASTKYKGDDDDDDDDDDDTYMSGLFGIFTRGC